MNDLLPATPTDGRTVDLLAVDRDIAHAVPDGEPLLVPALSLERGEIVRPERAGASALMLVSGAVWREVVVGRSVSPQVLHPGAVLLREPPPGAMLESEARAAALTPVTLAVLDRRFLAAAARWPGVMAVMHQRLAEQERDLAVFAAIGALSRVDDRLLLLLWHLAERWGNVVPEGVRVSLTLTHATLGRFVGARRPTVSLAVSELRERGELDRDVDGCWILTGRPPAAGADGAVPPGALQLPQLFQRAGRADVA